MAYLRLGHIKESTAEGTCKASGLRNCIDYIFNPAKTENGLLVAGYNLFVDKDNKTESVYNQMIATKNTFGKEDGRQGYHYKLSFSKNDDITPQKALEIAREFCARCFTDYECAFAVHTNTEHMHAHIVFNSIDMIEGKKYHYKKGEWANRIQPIANEICQKNGLSALDLDMDEQVKLKHKCMSYGKWVNQNGKANSKKLNYSNQMIRADIDECVKNANDYGEFLMLMQLKGHRINENGKYLTVLAPGRERPCRTYILTPDKSTYTKDNIIRMINGTFLSKEQTMDLLFTEWEKYKSDDRNYLRTVSLSPELAKKMETRKFKVEHELVDLSSAQYYMYKIEKIDKQLNIMRKYVNKGLDSQSENINIMNAILQNMDGYNRYVKTKDERYKEIYNETNSLYNTLCLRGINMEKLYIYNSYGQSLISAITDYKKHIYVEKKITGRIIRTYENER